MIRNAVVGLTSLALLACIGGWGLAEEDSAAEIYGRSVHAYNAGDFAKATGLLTQLIDKKTADPRPYYFRGLAQAGLGNLDAAKADYAQGAKLEVNGKQKFDVAQALQRVQGRQRIDIEQQRASARRAAVEKKKKRDQARYERLRRREDLVLYDPSRPAPDLSNLSIPEPAQANAPDPFGSDVVLTGGKPVEVAAPAAMETKADPFAPEGEEQPRDPFATSPAKPDEPEDPFGKTEKGGQDMPEEGEEAKEDPFGESPFGKDMPKAEEDPFGDIPDGAIPGAGAGGGGGAIGGIFRMLGKTLSEQSSDRNPFAESGAEGKAQTPESPPAEKPAEEPAKEPAKDAEAEDDPFK
jgi:hypothetical protein